MTNYERLLDLPFREILNELGADESEFFDCCKATLIEVSPACNEVAFCKVCDDTPGSCADVLKAWLERESDPDANYNEDLCFDFKKNPPHSDKIEDYLVIIDGLQFWNIAQLHGDEFLDIDGNVLNVTHYCPLPKLPEN